MPDPTYKTFLSPGSCQLEVTDLVAAANDDTGVDLYGVAWEIEQVLIAGEGFAASPTDVWVNERGILNVGQSLFDKINRTAEDNDNVPGQCTIVVKATSLVDSSKVARLKVLVGYPSEGGGGGGGGDSDFTTATVTLQAADGFSSALQLQCACVASEEGFPDATTTSVYSGDAPYEFTAVLYKGKCLASQPDEFVTMTTTGDVTYDEELEIYIITGDCTFTLSDANT